MKNRLLKHIVVTRFNVIFDEESTSLPSDEWMNKRLKIFHEYCAPSVLNQTNRNFSWLVYFDSRTNEKHREFINKLQEEFDFSPCYVAQGATNFFSQLKDDISLLLEEEIRFLITTRIDNDDCFHKNAVSKIQDLFTLLDKKNTFGITSRAAINLKKGYCLRIEPHYELAFHQHLSNAFISLVEKLGSSQEFSTVLSNFHDAYFYQNICPVFQIEDDRYWVQSIHETNLLNRMVGFPSMNRQDLSRFGLDISSVTFRKRDYIKNLFQYYWIPIQNKVKYVWFLKGSRLE